MTLTENPDRTAVLQGRLLAFEAMLTHLIWRWALDQPHTPEALARYLRPLEETTATLAQEAGNHPDAVAAMAATIRGVAESLEAALHAEALRRTGPSNPGNA